MASGHVVPHQQAGHMAAPTSLAPPSKKTLANGEPSTHGTSRKYRPPQLTTAYGSRPDSACHILEWRQCARSGHAQGRRLKRTRSARPRNNAAADESIRADVGHPIR